METKNVSKALFSLADVIKALAETLAKDAEANLASGENGAPETAQDGAPNLASEEEPTAAPVLRLEDVREVLADISRRGKTAEMRALLAKYGAEKLSDIDPVDYAALIEEAKHA